MTFEELMALTEEAAPSWAGGMHQHPQEPLDWLEKKRLQGIETLLNYVPETELPNPFRVKGTENPTARDAAGLLAELAVPDALGLAAGLPFGAWLKFRQPGWYNQAHKAKLEGYVEDLLGGKDWLDIPDIRKAGEGMYGGAYQYPTSLPEAEQIIFKVPHREGSFPVGHANRGYQNLDLAIPDTVPGVTPIFDVLGLEGSKAKGFIGPLLQPPSLDDMLRLRRQWSQTVPLDLQEIQNALGIRFGRQIDDYRTGLPRGHNTMAVLDPEFDMLRPMIYDRGGLRELSNRFDPNYRADEFAKLVRGMRVGPDLLQKRPWPVSQELMDAVGIDPLAPRIHQVPSGWSGVSPGP